MYPSRFHCGYQHNIFVISNKKYFAFASDTVANKLLIENKLSENFTKDEIERMQRKYNNISYCMDESILAPELIKRDEKVLFDLHPIKK